MLVELWSMGMSFRSFWSDFRRLSRWFPTRRFSGEFSDRANCNASAAGLFSGLRRICPNIFHRDIVTRNDKGVVPQTSYNFLFLIVVGYLIFRSCRRWLRWQTSSFRRMSLFTAQLEQLYKITDTTMASYILTSLLRWILRPCSHTFLKLLNAMFPLIHLCAMSYALQDPRSFDVLHGSLS